MGRGIHKKLRAILGGKGDSLPDERRAGHNLSYRLSDALAPDCVKSAKNDNDRDIIVRKEERARGGGRGGRSRTSTTTC